MRRAHLVGAVITRRPALSTPVAAVAARNIGSHPTSPVPASTTSYDVSYPRGNGVHVCFSGTRPLLAQVVVSEQPVVRPELCMEEIGAKLGQKTRFDRSGRIVFYDTAIRKDVRGRLTEYLGGADTEDPVRLVLTGMGGMGKSHNLALWVLEQRNAGHMVVYVNDMDDWLRFGDEYIFREIEFAICRWKHWSVTQEGACKNLDAVIDLVSKSPRTPTPPSSRYWRPV